MTKTATPRTASPGGRVYLDPSDSIVTEIDRLVEKLELRGRKDVIAEAVSLYAILVEEIAAGRRAGVIDPSTRDFVRIMTPGLRTAERNAVQIQVTKSELVRKRPAGDLVVG